MTHINNRIQLEIEKYLNNVFTTIGANQADEINELFRRFENLLNREDFKTLPENIQKKTYINRESLINDVINITNVANRISEIYNLIQMDKINLIYHLEEQIKYFKRMNVETTPTLDTLVNVAELIEDFEMKIAGQVIVYSVRSLRNLRTTVEKIYKSINLDNYRVENDKLIKQMILDVEKEKNKFEEKMNNIKSHIRKHSEDIIMNIINEVKLFNVPRNEIFNNFIEAVKKITNIEVEIEVYTPSFDDDILYVQFLDAKENNNREELLSIGLALFSDAEFLYDMSNEDLILFLEQNYFN